MRDLNISFPADRLRELVARGELGAIGADPLLVHGRAAGSPAHPGRDRARGRPPAARRGRGRGPDHAHLTLLHAHRRCAGPRARDRGPRHHVHQHGARAHREGEAAPRALRAVPLRPRAGPPGRSGAPASRPPRRARSPRRAGRPGAPRLPRRRGAGRSAGRAHAGLRRSRPPRPSRRIPRSRPRRCASTTSSGWRRSGGRTAFGLSRRARHALSRRGALPPGLRGRRGRRPGGAPGGGAAAELHPLLRGRLEGALLRGPPGHEARRDRRRRRAVVLGETAAAQVLRRVGKRLEASEDPRWKAAAFGVAR